MTAALRSNRELLLPCAAPYLVYVTVATLAAGRVERELDYALRIALGGAALALALPRSLPLRGPRGAAGSLALGALTGALGLGVWLAARAPFAPPSARAWTDLAFGLRLLASALLVPLFEEELVRGWLLGFAVQWERLWRAGRPDPLGAALAEPPLLALEPFAWTPGALAISSAAFALGHAPPEWPAALLYGALLGALRCARGDLLACVAAHAVTNLGLALYVRGAAAWALW